MIRDIIGQRTMSEQQDIGLRASLIVAKTDNQLKKLRIYLLLLMCIGLSGVVIAQESSPEQITIGKVSDVAKESYSLTGQMIDASSGSYIVGATIQIKGNSGGTASSIDGSYDLDLPRGRSSLLVSYVGYQAIEVDIVMYKDGVWDISLSPTAVELQDVVIQGEGKRANIDRVISGVERLDISQLEQKSQLLGELDVLRSIQTLSGVTSVGDGASGFNVRGGNSDENLILQDDALIINPTHTLGFFSLFHPDLIQSVSLYKGNQPAYYGGRLSSVLQVDLREGNLDSYEFNGGVGLVASRLTYEGPIQKGKSSFIVGGRISYMDYLLNLVSNINVKRSSTLFFDLTAKADARLSKKTKVGFSTFIAGDDFQFGDEVNFDYSTKTVTGYINHLISDKWNIRLVANVGDYESSLFDIQGVDLSRFTTGVRYARASLRNFVEVNESINLLTGIEYNRYTVNPGQLDPEGEQSTAVSSRLDTEVGQAITPYLQLEWKPSDRLTILGAVRFTRYSNLGPGQVAIYEEGRPRNSVTLTEIRNVDNGSIVSYTGWEPRASVNLAINENAALKLGYNRGYQYLNQLSNTASATPIDIWKLSDTYIEPQVADNYNLGWFNNFEDNKFESSLEVFYRDQKTIVEYRDFADLLLNEFLERDVVEGIGRSYGIEANFKKTSGRFNYQLNYTYSRSERRVLETAVQRNINQGEWYPSNFDKPHSFNLTVSQKTGPKTNLSVNFTYSTGRPITAPVSNFGIDNVLNVPIFSERNQFRIPDYHRLDIAYTIGPFGKKNGSNNLTFSIYNLYSRRNAYSVFFRQKPFQSLSVLRIATLGSIFPSVTYNFNFK